MNQPRQTPTRVSAARAVLLIGLAIAGAAVTWHLRPATGTSSTAPEADIILGCAWLAWSLAGYLLVSIAAASLAHLAAGLGHTGRSIARIAPARLRRLVDTAITLGVSATILGSASVGAASAAVPPPHQVVATQNVAGSALDWPGLAVAPGQPAATHHRDAPVRRPHHHADVGLVSGAHANHEPAGARTVVVQPGDTLWTLAARELGPGASGSAITASWHAWYDANRGVIGPNPSLIHPGQVLAVPVQQPSPTS